VNFDYEQANARISSELKEMAEQLWLEIQPIYKKYGWGAPENKVDGIRSHVIELKDEKKRDRFFLLIELREGKYWHAVEYWNELRGEMTKEERDFYAQLTIEQAKRDSRLGYSWIVREYDKGHIRDYVPAELLKEAVNRGFWEIANEYFTTESLRPPWEDYERLMKYKDLLDLGRLREFKTEKMLRCRDGWPDSDFFELFEKVRGNLSLEDGAWLVRPIIEQRIAAALFADGYVEHPEAALKKELELFAPYLSTKIVQELLREKMKGLLRLFSNDDRDLQGHYILCLKILSKYLTADESETRSFVSSSLPRDAHEIEEAILRTDFPKQWLDEDAMKFLREKMIRRIESPQQRYGKAKDLIPNLSFIQEAVKKGFLDREFGRKRINDGLLSYLAMKHRPAGDSVLSLLDTLDPDLVSPPLYREVVNEGISDLLKRKKAAEARRWYRKAKETGLLDEKKVPATKELEEPEPAVAAPIPPIPPIPHTRRQKNSRHQAVSRQKIRGVGEGQLTFSHFD